VVFVEDTAIPTGKAAPQDRGVSSVLWTRGFRHGKDYLNISCRRFLVRGFVDTKRSHSALDGCGDTLWWGQSS
jgi:hypothetical protein